MVTGKGEGSSAQQVPTTALCESLGVIGLTLLRVVAQRPGRGFAYSESAWDHDPFSAALSSFLRGLGLWGYLSVESAAHWRGLQLRRDFGSRVKCPFYT